MRARGVVLLVRFGAAEEPHRAPSLVSPVSGGSVRVQGVLFLVRFDEAEVPHGCVLASGLRVQAV